MVMKKKIVYPESELAQRSEKWLQKRQGCVGGSEVADVLGIGFQKAQTLWKRKTKRLQPKKENANMARGTLLEDEALEKAKQTPELQEYDNLNIQKFFAYHPKYDFIGVSFDGVDIENKFIVEIKCPSKVWNFRSVFEDGVPDYYYPQIQLQLMVAKEIWGIEKAYFASYFKGGTFILDKAKYIEYNREIVVIDVDYDKPYIKAMEKALKRYSKFLREDYWDKEEYDKIAKEFDKFNKSR